MQLRTYNWRASLIQSKTTGQDELVDKILEGGLNSDLLLSIEAIKTDRNTKSYVEASLLSSNDFELISDILEIDLDVIALYAKIHYDVAGLNRISKLSLVEASADEEDRARKLWALSQGLDFVAWRLGKKVNISAVEGLTALFNDCIYKSKEAIFSDNSSMSSKESAKWVKLSVEIAKLLKVWVQDNKAANADLEIALKQVIPNFKSFDQLEQGQTGNLFDEPTP